MFNDNLFGQNFEEEFNSVFNVNKFDFSNEFQHHINDGDLCTYYLPNISEEINIVNSNTNEKINNSIKNTESEKKTIGKKRGRKKKEDAINFEIPREDNSIKEFKTKFFQKYLIGICNKLIEKYSPNETKRFKKIEKEVINNLNIKPNLKLLNSPLKYFLSYDISDKYKNCDKEYNKNLLNKYSNFNDYFSVLFKTSINALYKIFINDNCVNINKKLFTIESDLSLKYFLNEIDNIKRKEYTEKSWKDIYSFFKNKKKIKSEKEDFY